MISLASPCFSNFTFVLIYFSRDTHFFKIISGCVVLVLTTLNGTSMNICGVQFNCSVVSNPFPPHGLQHARVPYPSPSPEFIFQCSIFLSFHAVHGVCKARILNWFAISFSSGPCFVRTLHHDPSVLGGPTWHGS